MSQLELWARALRNEPYDGPWPRPNAPAHSVDAWFTNADARLRPGSRVPSLQASYYFLPGHDSLRVTPYNFPELHARFTAMQERAGIHPQYQLVIGREVPGKAAISSSTRTVSVDLGILNRSDFDSFQFWLGHELGHAWQFQNPGRRTLPVRDSRVSSGDRWESEADIFALCMTNDRASILRGMSRLSQGGGENHAPREARQAAVSTAQWSDCFASGLAEIPRFLRAPTPRPRQ